ncbi:MAG: glycosyltransferase [Rhodothermia bacterium]|nr:glycosyltransferase [Rhodothermia bacterium]
MSILQLSNSDNPRASGAVVAMYNIHNGLQDRGITSRIACGRKTTDDPGVHQIAGAAPRSVRLTSRVLDRAFEQMGLNNLGNVNSFWLGRRSFFQDADVLHIHQLHGSEFSYAALPRLTVDKPAVFTFHDMWAMTGHCGFSFDCERWKSGCGNCPYPDVFPSIRRDSTAMEWRLKKRFLNDSNLAIIAICSWTKRLLAESMLSDLPIHLIPNGIDTHAYRPRDTEQSKRVLGLPPDKVVLLVSAARLTNHRKGADLLVKAIQQLPQSTRQKCCLMTMGKQGAWLQTEVDIEVKPLGFVADTDSKAVAYSAADVFVHPSRADTLPLVLQESMACGTPMIAFDVGGVSDLVRNQLTGWLIRPEDPDDLARGIEEAVEDEPTRLRMRETCRSVAQSEFSIELSVDRHINLYQSLTQAS